MVPGQIIRIFNIFLTLSILPLISTQQSSLCDALHEVAKIIDNATETEHLHDLCNKIHSSETASEHDEFDSIADFDLTQIESDADANQILKRFRRGRGGGGGGRSGGGGSRSGGGSRFSSSFSRSSSSSSGSRFFGGSRSSSSSSSGSSRIFSGSRSSSGTGSGSRFFSRSSVSSSSGQSGHRVREAVRSMFRHSPSSSSSRSSTFGGSSGISGSGGIKPGFGDKIRQITHSGGSSFGGMSSGSSFSGTGGSGSSNWVRAGKKFLPAAVRYGKRYYQRRKYQQGMYAGAGYYAGSRMAHNRPDYYYSDPYGYPPTDIPTETNNNPTPTTFYCIQEDLNTTLVNKTLDSEGFGTCNISGVLVKCPIEIECKTDEADNCCEDEQGTPYCCGGPLPEEFASVYGGYEDDLYDAAGSINRILNIATALSVLSATMCYTIWHRRGH